MKRFTRFSYSQRKTELLKENYFENHIQHGERHLVNIENRSIDVKKKSNDVALINFDQTGQNDVN